MKNDELVVLIEGGESNGEKSIRLAFGVGEDEKSYIFPVENAVEIAKAILETANIAELKNGKSPPEIESVLKIAGEVHTSIDLEKMNSENGHRAVTFTIGYNKNGEKKKIILGIPPEEAVSIGKGLREVGRFAQVSNEVLSALRNTEHLKEEELLDKLDNVESAVRELDTEMLKKLSALLKTETNPDEVNTRKMVSVKCGINRKGDPLICVEIANTIDGKPVQSTLIDLNHEEARSFGIRIQKCAELTKFAHDDLKEIYPDITTIPREELSAKLTELAAKHLSSENYRILDSDPEWQRSSGVEFSDRP